MEDHKKALLERPWEQRMGKDPAQRTQLLGYESHDYRKMVNLPPVSKEKMDIHNTYIHRLGADVLKAQFDEEKQIAMERAAIEKKKQKVAKILKRKIKVTDLDDGGVSVSIDQEWDTSTWNDELVVAGCEALVYIFFDTSERASIERKDRAVQMLQKLLNRHTAAENYMRKNIDALVGKAANKQMRGGRCMGLLDLFYVLRSCRESFAVELSRANFCGRVFEALNQEARLAAIFIQHTFRSRRSRSKTMQFVRYEGFGTERDIRATRMAVVNARSTELRTRWKSMHAFCRERIRRQQGGIRGPIHIGATYTTLVLDILMHLVSPECFEYAHANREDIVNAQGCTLLSTFLAGTMGPFSYQAAIVLGNVAKAARSFEQILFSGCIESALRLLRHLRLFLEVGKRAPINTAKVKITPHTAYLGCCDIIYYTALHAAGLYRATRGYRTATPAYDEVEKAEYAQLLRFLKSPGQLSGDVIKYLGNPDLLKELSAMILRTSLPDLLLSLLRCFFALLSCNAHYPAAVEITALSGMLMIRLLELVHSNNDSFPPAVGAMALAVYMQLCTQFLSRQQLSLVNIEKYFSGPRKLLQGQYENHGYQRGILVTAALCRQAEWRAYDPTVLLRDLQADSDSFRLLLFYDLLRTMKCMNLPDSQSEIFSIADMVVLPTDDQATEAMSRSAATFGVKSIIDFIVRPEQEFYYEKLPLHEAAASCVILEGLAADEDAARRGCSSELFNFMSRYIYLCKYLFLGRTMLSSQITVILNGVKSALVAMGRYAASAREDAMLVGNIVRVLKKTELVNSALFFMKTLSVSHPKLSSDTRELQKQVGCCALDFFIMYALVLTHIEGQSSVASLRDLYPPGQATADLVNFLKVVHGKGPFVITVFAKACELLRKCTSTSEATFLAINEWHVIESLRVYLPTPLSGILPEEIEATSKSWTFNYDSAGEGQNGDDSSEHQHLLAKKLLAIEEYKVGLMQLPPAFFELCANLCAAKNGKEACFAEGFLRRALDKLTVLNSTFVKHNLQFLRDPEKDREWGKISLDLIACLRLVAGVANFSDKKLGAANDLILNHLYGTIALCKNAICWKLHTNHPRTDELVLVAYETLAELAYDSYRCSALLEKYDIFSVVSIELAMLDTLPERGARAAVRILHRSCFGLTSDYVMRMIPRLREPLTRVSRVYPLLHDLVKETQWTLTKCGMVYKKSTGRNFIGEDEEQEEYIRSGASPVKSQHQYSERGCSTDSLLAAIPAEDNSSSNGKANDPNDEILRYGPPFRINRTEGSMKFSSGNDLAGSKKMNYITDINADERMQNEEVDEHVEDTMTNAGRYSHCGISNCGSLRLQDEPLQHGEHSTLSQSEREQQMLHLTFGDSEVMDISKLSARSPELRGRIAEVKGKAGFSPLLTTDVMSDPAYNRRLLLYSDSAAEKLTLSINKSEQLGQSPGNTSIRKDLLPSPSKVASGYVAGSMGNSPKPLISAGSASLSFSPARKRMSSAPHTPLGPTQSMSSPQQLRIRSVSVAELPELMLTRPPPSKSKPHKL